jgi:hypothetical protein
LTYISAIKNLSPAEVGKSCRLPCDAHDLRMRFTAKPTEICSELPPLWAQGDAALNFRTSAGVG